MSTGHIGIVLTTFKHLDYAAAAAARSLAIAEPPATLFIVDDGSPDFQLNNPGGWPHIVIHRFPSNGGLTRSMNKGLEMAAARGCDTAVVANSDIVAPRAWWKPLLSHLWEDRLDFVGPLTNAPGTAGDDQNVKKYMPNYELTDNQQDIDNISYLLRMRFPLQVLERPINGFFMAAKMEKWKAIAVDHTAGLYFPERIDVMPSGAQNPTPLMSGQEHWLAARCRELHLRMGIAMNSFCFHYRSLSRGDRYKTTGWYRPKEKS